MSYHLPTSVARNLFTGAAATNPLRGNKISPAASGNRDQVPVGGIPPIQVNVSNQPVVNLGSRPSARHTAQTTLRKRGAGSQGDGTTGAQDPLVVRTRDPHTDATLAQFRLQAVSALQGPANDAKEGSGRVVDWFMQLLGITGTPR